MKFLGNMMQLLLKIPYACSPCASLSRKEYSQVMLLQTEPPPGEMCFFEAFRHERMSDPRATWVMDFSLRVDELCDVFSAAGGEGAVLEVMFMGVLPEARGRGVGRRLVSETLGVARQAAALGVTAVFTSDVSRAIGRSLGFKVRGKTRTSANSVLSKVSKFYFKRNTLLYPSS